MVRRNAETTMQAQAERLANEVRELTQRISRYYATREGDLGRLVDRKREVLKELKRVRATAHETE